MKIQTDTKIILMQIIFIILSAVVVYWNSLGGKFMWDDFGLIKDNAYITHHVNIPVFFTRDMGVGSNVQSNYYRPLQMVTNKIDYMFWGVNPLGYHITNLIFHILTALVLFWLLNVLFNKKNISFVASLLFVVHPVHVEAVSYISGRSDSLAALGMLLSLVFYAKYILCQSYRFYIFALGSFVVALLSKENSVILPFLLFPVHFVYRKKPAARALLPFFGLLAAYLLFRQLVVHPILFSSASLGDMIQRIPGFLRSIARYLQILSFPLGLHLEYDHRMFSIYDPIVIAGIVSSIFLVGLAWIKKYNAIVLFSILWFFLGLIPVSNILNISYPYMMEHWCYFSSIGFFLIVSYTLFLISKTKLLKSAAVLFAASLFIFYSYSAIGQVNQWRDPVTVFETALRYSPSNSMLYMLLGDEYLAAGNKEQAIVAYKKAITLKHDFFDAYISMGNTYYQWGKPNDAAEIYGIAMGLFPKSSKPYIGLANILTQTGREKEAISLYRKAIENDPKGEQAYYNLGIVYKKLGQPEQAITMFNKVLRINPNFLLAYYQLGSLYKTRQEADKLYSLYRKAVANNLAYFDAYYSLADTYSQEGKYSEAILLYKRAIKINSGFAESYFNLGKIYFAMKRDEESIAYFKKAVELDPDLAVAYSFIALAYASQNKYVLAIQYCDKAALHGYKINPQFLELLKPYRE
ncbi:MAG: tetratricopeptide repeat protein [Candidatus Omnitrophota bacterium]